MSYDVVIIGAGPGGLTAGIYAGRAGLKTLIIEKFFSGGQASQTYEIENYPGFLKIGGFDLMEKCEKQAKESGAEIQFCEIERVDLNKKKIYLTSGEVIESKTIIIASGATHAHLGINGEDELIGQGVSYCATCDGAFYKGKTVAIVGGGNTAVSDALYLNKFAKSVYIIHRRNEFRASPVLVERMRKNGTIIKTPYTVSSLNIQNKKLKSITIVNKENQSEHVAVDGLFVAVGQTPETRLFDVQKDEKGYIVTDENMKTNLDGVYAVGDCRAKFLRQVVTACADGAIASEQALLYITLNN